ncbi:MAG: sugar ABC transporter substrate-binding protein [Blautia sp.]|nr:sugar ABC transporter substrate-binding protein [Blautia sp.]
MLINRFAGALYSSLVFAACASFFLLPGCGQRYTALEPGRDHEPRIMGATYMTRNNPFFEVVHEGISSVVEGNGDILISRDPSQNQEKQNEQIQEMIDEGIEVLFLNPVDWKTVTPALEACREAGVVVINVDTAVKEQEYVVTLIETDNYQAGVLCAEDMMRRVEKARIVILDNPIQMSITQRVQGFLDTIEGHDGYEVVYQKKSDGEFEVGAANMTEFLGMDIDFDVVLGGNDPDALGAFSALQQAGYEKDVLIYGIDGSPDFKAMILEGEVTGSSAQSPGTLGRTAAETAYQYLNGEEIEPYISIAPFMINIDNIGEYNVNDWE